MIPLIARTPTPSRVPIGAHRRFWRLLFAQIAAISVAVTGGACVLTLRTGATSRPAVAATATPAGAVATSVGLGDSGDTVRQVQFVLRSYRYTVAVDGIYGPQTRRAVAHWQRANGLRPDGVADARTLASLHIAPVPRPAIPSPVAPTFAGAGDQGAESIIRQVWPDELEDHAVMIATRESRLVPTARNACCYGLFQIHWGAHRGWLASIGVTSPSQLLDAQTNATAALALYQRNGWAPWML